MLIPADSGARCLAGQNNWLLGDFLVVVQKLSQTDIGERMIEQHIHNLEGHGADMRSCFG